MPARLKDYGFFCVIELPAYFSDMRTLWLCLFLISLSAAAQPDRGRGTTLNIPPVDAPAPEPEKPEKPAEEKKDPYYVPPSIKGEPSGNAKLELNEGVDFSAPKPKFVNPGKEVEDKINQKGDGQMYKALRENQYLGDFRTNAKKVRVMYRDHGVIDGDQIRVLVNDKVYIQTLFLDGTSQYFELELVDGINKIDFEALNQGRVGENSAEFDVIDAETKTRVSANQWYLATGFKATIILIRE